MCTFFSTKNIGQKSRIACIAAGPEPIFGIQRGRGRRWLEGKGGGASDGRVMDREEIAAPMTRAALLLWYVPSLGPQRPDSGRASQPGQPGRISPGQCCHGAGQGRGRAGPSCMSYTVSGRRSGRHSKAEEPFRETSSLAIAGFFE